MAASSWFADGTVSTYDAASAGLAANIFLATNGAVDTNATTRFQYPTPDPFTNNLIAVAKIRVTYEDYFHAKSPGLGGDPANQITGIMYVAPANMVPTAPSISQILTAALSAGLVFASTTYTTPVPVDGFVDMSFPIIGPASTQLSPNTKYWVAVLPRVWKPSNPLSTATILYTATFPHVLGRAVSFWSNRTPAAPVISSPVANSVLASNSLINLSITASDPDAVGGSNTPPYSDIAGVHVQYAARPSADNPNPPWYDLPFATSGGTLLNKGWWIKGSNANLPGEGVAALALTRTVQVRCGAASPTPSAGLLPSGTWQIRVRTFDFGHPWPNLYNPLVGYISGGSYSPSNYPAANTSPWSAPVIITISAQVPAPIPLFPVGNVAVAESLPVTLSWQYRNTAVPPFPQSHRSIRIRKVGEAVWTDLLAFNASASASYTISGYPLVSGNHYEWQVRTRDSSGVDSVWSDIVRFWVVPTPASGAERPLPSSSIDGATLGCGNNRVFIFRRGGLIRVAELTGITSVEWNRTRDDISTAEVVVSGWDQDCGFLLSQLEPWAYEIVIIRDNGYSRDRVWEGPITLLTYQQDKVTIDAKDVMAYAYRRLIRQQMDDSRNGDSVISRGTRILQNAFAPDDPNILAYLTLIIHEDDPMQYRSTPAYARTAFEEIDDMAANSGLDYGAYGRAILLWGTKRRIGTLPEFKNENFGSPPIVSVYGMSTANVYVVSDGNGIYGQATRLDEFGKDETYGLVEMLSSSWASDSEPEEGTYTQAGLDKVRASFAESAERSIASRYPPPVVVRVPDNTTLNPDTVVSIQQLLPGVVIPLRSTGTLRTVVANQKLDAVKVVQNRGASEVISITMSPFSRDDAETSGEEE